jgi:ABC-2 type transport system permease protein
LPSEIAEGKITKYLLKPQDFVQMVITRGFGASLAGAFYNLFSVPLILMFFYQNIVWNFSSMHLLAFFVIIMLSMFIRSFYQIISACVSFVTPEYSGIITTSEVIAKIFSGSMVPLSLLGGWSFLKYSPFAYTFYHPMQIYLGKYSTTEILYTFTGGIVWCFILWILARIIFKLGLKKNEAVGL